MELFFSIQNKSKELINFTKLFILLFSVQNRRLVGRYQLSKFQTNLNFKLSDILTLGKIVQGQRIVYKSFQIQQKKNEYILLKIYSVVKQHILTR